MRISCRGLGTSGLGRKLPTHEPLVGAGRFGHVCRCNPGGLAPPASTALGSGETDWLASGRKVNECNRDVSQQLPYQYSTDLLATRKTVAR
jgi:hypothetical protein